VEPDAALAGVKVVDLTQTLAGPWCTQVLASLGADVVKLERLPAGDEARRAGPPFWEGESALFLAANSGKRSLAVDLKSAAGREAALRLVEGADVFVQSLRPGAADRLGLGFDDVRGRNDRVVYCSVGAFGKRGPRAEEPGYDPLMQAAAGIMSTTAEPGRRPIRTGPSAVDIGTGMWAVIGILGALLRRDAVGAAQLVDTSLYETAVNYQPMQFAGYLASGIVPPPLGRAQRVLVPLEVFAATDGELMVAAASDRLFGALCAAVEMPGLADDPRFRTNSDRVENHAALSRVLGERFAERTLDEWSTRLRAAGVPAAPVSTIDEVVADEQFRALGLLQELPHPEIDDLRLVAPPLSIDDRRLPLRWAAPQLGEHSREVLAEVGYSAAEVEGLEREGAIGLHTGSSSTGGGKR